MIFLPRPVGSVSAAIAAILVVLCALGPGALHAEGPNGPGDPPPAAPAVVAPMPGVAVTWEVGNRFRLFREERDFRRHVEALRGHSVLEAEQAPADATDGRGWAAEMVGRLCVDAGGRLALQCMRDGVTEDYLDPADHRVELRLVGRVPPDATCMWSFSPAGEAPPADMDCATPAMFRVPSGKTTIANVDIALAGETIGRASTEIAVRDLLIAGLGDSVASGDGNPDRPVALADDGFCFRRLLPFGRAEYFRPGRLGFAGDRACDAGSRGDPDRAAWAQLSAHWMNAACHRSLYGYQLRTALALAAETPHAAVTFLPLACTGAGIETGLFNGQRAREIVCPASASCSTEVPAQLVELRDLLGQARRKNPDRALDLVFLTIGANDIGFAGLVADVMIEGTSERALFTRAGIISSVASAQATLDAKLPDAFARLRAALKPLVNNMLDRVVFVTYGNPALRPQGGPCPGGRDGFDIHPAFGVDAERLRRVAAFVEDKFLPALKAAATCAAKGACADPADAMTFADEHQAGFAAHGFCARAMTDPEFDRACFSPDGKSFTESLVEGATAPLACGRDVGEFRPYARRERWIRTANDSYFTAMTFPEDVGAALRPSDLHDAGWGLLSAVYGGAIHPTAEGEAAMADAALAAAKTTLALPVADAPVIAEPLPPLEAPVMPVPAPPDATPR
jgi:hypothetical protein